MYALNVAGNLLLLIEHCLEDKRTPRSKKKLARSTPEKRQLDVKERKNMLISGSTEACLVPRNLMEDESMLHSIPDLRMEAKKTAEVR